ncbi:MAG: redoxin domain-containing protein [Pedosphaera sp.]|nr:redoxin domain-containing protein [Pedosphaera sp.]
MNRTIAIVATSLCLPFCLPAEEAPKFRPDGDLAAIFKSFDKNGDGKVTKEEAGNAAWFDRIDLNRDAEITREELATVAKIYLARRAGGLDGGLAVPGGAAAAVDVPLRQGPKILKAADQGVGRLLPDAKFTDINGKSGKLSGFKSAPALVIAFTTTSCPVTKKYAPTLARLEKEFGARGVKFLFVNPTASDSRDSIKAAIKDHGFAGRYVHDRDGKLTAALGAQTTAEIFVLDAARTLVFRGAVDDQYGLGYSLDAPHENYLRDALAAVLAHESPAIAATAAPGCALNVGDDVRRRTLDSQQSPASTSNRLLTSAPTGITYHNRISRLIQNNCLECHHAGGLGPFSLETYAEVKAHAGMVRKQVDREVMPPWFAAPGKAGEPSHWANDRSLSEPDKRDLLAWLASDKPLGNSADAPLAKKFSSQWRIGEPDAVFQLPQPVAIKAEGTMPYQFVTVDTSFPEDRWVSAYEIIPTAREVVHHVITMVHAKGSTPGDQPEATEGYWAAYVPGNSWRVMPAGFGKKLPAGATISFQIHYTPNGKATTDQMRLGVKFATKPPDYSVHVLALPQIRLNIPPGEANHVETAEQRVPYNLNLTAFMAHTHVRGKSFKYEVTYPDGRHETLLDIPRYDFNWQLRYECAETKRIPAGSLMKITATYDNSRENPANPDPTKTVRWGKQTSDEMMIGYMECYTPNAKPAAPVAAR